jgi:hypothetical protein
MGIRIRFAIFIFIFFLALGFMFIKFDSHISSQEIIEIGDELEINMVRRGEFSAIIKPNYLVFSKEDALIRHYANMLDVPVNMAYNPGVNLDYNMGVVVGLGEVYRAGYEIILDRAIYLGKSIELYVDVIPPGEKAERTTQSPYIIASVYSNKKIRQSTRVIKFIDNQTERLIRSLPVKQIGRYPFYEIPEEVRVFTVEQGDYCNVKQEAYGAFNNHNTFEYSYVKLLENDDYKVRPPELSFLGNIAIIMTLGEQENGGYEIVANGAFTNSYMMGRDLFIMVRKKEPTEDNIRYYDITQPYYVASIQIGFSSSRINNVTFVDEATGKILVNKELRYYNY